MRRDIREGIADFESAVQRGFGEVRRRPSALANPSLLVLADRFGRLGALWFCAAALGIDVEPGVLVTGFAIVLTIGVMSMAPGGISVQEGSMAGTYHLLGMSLEEALALSLLFRVVHQLVPSLASVTLYRVRRAPLLSRFTG